MWERIEDGLAGVWRSLCVLGAAVGTILYLVDFLRSWQGAAIIVTALGGWLVALCLPSIRRDDSGRTFLGAALGIILIGSGLLIGTVRLHSWGWLWLALAAAAGPALVLAGDVIAILFPSRGEPERGRDDVLPARMQERDYSRL